MGANREYKNSVFTTLFSDIGRLLSLYNALSGSNLPINTIVKIATLKDVLFTDRRNDIAFVLDDKIVILIEHQSTINENMPLRLLIYVARLYEKLIDNNAVYKNKLFMIPKPDFIVLYNGTSPFPDEKILRLSDAYKEHPKVLSGIGGSLELEVRVININEGRNESIVKKCEALYGYVRFIGKVRENLKTEPDLKKALTKSLEACINEGILADFLKTHSSEVSNMLTTQWNAERAMEVREQEAREEGLEQGREEGLEQGLEQGLEKGLEQGLEQGVDISAEIMRELIGKTPIEEIAVRYKVSVTKIKQLQSVLELYSA
jgi:hypothetical protein